jgi:hypothetical protein
MDDDDDDVIMKRRRKDLNFCKYVWKLQHTVIPSL